MGCSNCGGGLFKGSNDWVWIIIAIIVICFLCNDGGLFGSSDSNICC
jgi:hypothetical protein